jgi:hypothetical protein
MGASNHLHPVSTVTFPDVPLPLATDFNHVLRVTRGPQRGGAISNATVVLLNEESQVGGL